MTKRNFLTPASHLCLPSAIEMGADPEREPPFYFTKPPDAVMDAVPGATVPYPTQTSNFHFEFEVCL